MSEPNQLWVVPSWGRLEHVDLTVFWWPPCQSAGVPSGVLAVSCAMEGSFNTHSVAYKSWMWKEDVCSAFSCHCLPKGIAMIFNFALKNPFLFNLAHLLPITVILSLTVCALTFPCRLIFLAGLAEDIQKYYILLSLQSARTDLNLGSDLTWGYEQKAAELRMLRSSRWIQLQGGISSYEKWDC